MRLISIPPLNDAYFHLNQAKGLPVISSAKELRRVYSTSCILLSWIAMEVSIADCTKKLLAKGQLTVASSKGLLESAARLAVFGRSALDTETFRRLRRMRNEIVHPRIDDRDVDLPVSVPSETFDFCAQVIQDFYRPTKLILR